MVELSEQEKAVEAERLRTETGATYQSIANRLGFASKTAARDAVVKVRQGGQVEALTDTDDADELEDVEVSPPPAYANKSVWVEYVVEHHGLSEEDAKDHTRDQLAELYGAE